MRATALGVLLLVACQTYDFEPTVPLGLAQNVKTVNIGARPLKPALFLVVDKSGSMLQEVAPGVSRMDAMKAAMGTFLTQDGASAHLGMLHFPANANACAGGDIANVDVPLDQGDEDDARLASYALQVKSAIDGLTAAGGTPTAATMHALTSYAPLLERNRDRFAVLLTDGVPNCNPALDVSTCTCTTAGQRPCSSGSFNLCLDDQGSSTEIALLNTRGIRTIVIGFGTDVANALGATTMVQMAGAGGFTRPCTTSADCNPGDTCNAGGVDPCGRPASVCGQSFFQAGNAAELGRVLQAIKDSVTCPACLQVLSPGARPDSEDFVSVLVDGVPTQPGADTWRYLDSPTAPTIEFVGALCTRLSQSTVQDPVKVEIRTVEKL